MALVQNIVGHASPAMTRHYTRLGVESLRSAVESIPSSGAVSLKALPAATAADDGRLHAAEARLAMAAEIVAAASTAEIAPGLRAELLSVLR